VSQLRPAADIAPPPAPTPPRVALENVRKSFVRSDGERVDAVGPVDLEVAPGEFVCLIGPSGCGKTTILNLVAGLDRPDDGRVSMNGRPIAEPGADRAVLFQEPALFPWMSVRANVEYALKLVGVPKADRGERAMAVLERVKLASFANAQPHELSGGLRQRAALARALATQPEVLLADEPFGSLDALSREVLQHELEDVWTETRNTFLFVTHNVREAVFLADRVLLMSPRPGRFVSEHRIGVARPRSLEDVLLASVIRDIHDHLQKEVEEVVAGELLDRSDLA
jgi:NitT/TauT family transport system ATP-binding protein